MFDSILDAFVEADLPCYSSFILLLNNWHQEILNSFQRPYDNRKESNALTENINGKIREYITVSNGLSNFDRFRARALYSLNKHLTYTITDHLRSHKRSGKKRGNYNKLLCNDQSQVVFQRYLERASNSIFRALATLLFAHQDESLRRSMVSALSPTV